MVKARVGGPLLTAIAAATRWLDGAGVPSAIIGGIAASLLGRPRVTKDVDLVVLAEESTWAELLASGKLHGIVPRVEDALEFARTTRVLLLLHEPSGVELDISFASLPFERELIERATVRSVRGVSFKLATPEDLLIMKALALRPRDIADIEGILTLVEQLDLERVRRTVSEFSVALESHDFLGELDRILKAVKRYR
jgi:predicted nucleotidyltransferase